MDVKEEAKKEYKDTFVSKSSMLDYSKIATLGKGAFANVHLVKKEKDEKLYAMKIIDK